MVKFHFGLGKGDDSKNDDNQPAVTDPTTSTQAQQDDDSATVVVNDETVQPAVVAEINPFADATISETDVSVSESAPVIEEIPEVPNEEVTQAVDNPSADNANTLETITETNTDPIATNTEAEANPFASTPEPVVEKIPEIPNEEATQAASNPFADNTNASTVKEVAPVTDTAPLAAVDEIDPFASDDNTAVAPELIEDDTKTEIHSFDSDNTEVEETTQEVEEDSSTQTDNQDPLASLSLIKGEIENFVALHKTNITDYEDQIKGLQNEIKEEKELLKTKKAEFHKMLQEIEMLTANFQKEEKEEKHENHNKKKHKHHQKNKNSE